MTDSEFNETKICFAISAAEGSLTPVATDAPSPGLGRRVAGMPLSG